MSDQRVIGNTNKGKIGGSSSALAAETTPAAPAGPKRRGKRPLVVLALVVLLLGGGAGYWFVLGPGGAPTSAAEPVEPEVELGPIQNVEPISVNLADGRYLRLGLGLQPTAEVTEDIDPSKALDRAIALFSMRTVGEISTNEGRETLKKELVVQLQEAYEGEIVGVYFTTFVTQ